MISNSAAAERLNVRRLRAAGRCSSSMQSACARKKTLSETDGEVATNLDSL